MALKQARTANRLAASALIFAMAAVPAGQAAADSGLVGGIVGGIIGGAIVNEANKNRRTTTTTRSSSGVSSAQRSANRETQVALNYFGFPVGTPDGALGPRSRSAITTYQVTLGFPGTGQLNDFERDLLVTSYYRAQAGGPQVAQMIATNPRGVQGLLIAWKDERLGIPPAAPVPGAGTATFAATPVVPAAPSVPTFAATPVAPAESALPSFLAQGATQVSLASHCNKVSLVTNSNGGFVTQVTMTDPGFALSEQFCLARTYAMAQGEDLVSKVQGVPPQQIAAQCAGLGPVLKDNVSAVSLSPREAVLQGVSSFVLGSGMAPAQLAGTAKICLGVGYTTDNMDVAMGSALLLVALGEAAYGELIAHHLAQGIGATRRPDLALAWFDGALGTPGAAEVTSVFAPGMTDRVGLVRMAAYATAGQPLPGGTLPAAPGAAAAVPTGLPTFNIPFVTTTP